MSFIITAHNETSRIAAKIENTLAQDYPGHLEIVVASDCSTDGTDDVVRGYAPRVRLVRTPERRGKEAAQQVAIAATSGDILVFSDVATALAPDGVSRITANFADPTVGCVSSVDRFVDADGQVSGEGAYVRYEMFLRALETQVNSVVGLSGSFFAARRVVCRNWSADRQSDFNTLLNSVQLGLRGVLDPSSIGYYHPITDHRAEFQRKVRTVVRGIGVLAGNLSLLNPLRVRALRVAAGQPQTLSLARTGCPGDRAGDERSAGGAFAVVRGHAGCPARFLRCGRRRLGRQPHAQDSLLLFRRQSRHPDGLVPLRARRAHDDVESVTTSVGAASDLRALSDPLRDGVPENRRSRLPSNSTHRP